MTTSQKASKIRITFLSLIVAILGMLHVNFLFTNSSFIGIAFVAILILMFWKSLKKETKNEVNHFQYKTASILSFLLPISAIIYTFIFTGKAVTEYTSEAEQAGAAIGSAIGGGIMTVLAFIVGLSLGIVFYILSSKAKK